MNILEIKNLKVSIKNKTILYINQLNINENDHVVILGENGAGKTTLVNSILDLIKYDGNIVRKFKIDDCGVVFQENNYGDLFTVSDFIDLVLNKKSRDFKEKLIKEFKLDNLRNTIIKNLSGGEKQRLTISILLSQNKSIYFFDEITTGLDYEKRLELNNSIREKINNKTTFTISHHFDEVENHVNKVIILYKGKLIYSGLKSSLFEDLPFKYMYKIPNHIIADFDIDNNTIFSNDIFSFVFSQQDNLKIMQKYENEVKLVKKNLETSYIYIKYTKGEIND